MGYCEQVVSKEPVFMNTKETEWKIPEGGPLPGPSWLGHGSDTEWLWALVSTCSSVSVSGMAAQSNTRFPDLSKLMTAAPHPWNFPPPGFLDFSASWLSSYTSQSPTPPHPTPAHFHPLRSPRHPLPAAQAQQGQAWISYPTVWPLEQQSLGRQLC